jgi:ABC-type branched-subunit amino acid transport system ATPase component
MAALGFALFSVPLCINRLLQDQFGLDAWQRGLFGSVTALPGLVALVLAAPRADALLRRNPSAVVVYIGVLIASFGVVFCACVWMPNVVLLGVLFAVAMGLAQAAYVCTIAFINLLIPHQLRSRGTAVVSGYLMVLGAFFGALQVATNLFGLRGSLVAIVLPGAVLGGALVAQGSRFVRADMSLCVEELIEDKAEADRVAEPDAEDRVIQVRTLDFSYGSVQVLFDVNLDVRRGETVALLGTNGAGKSTLLRVISGLGVPTRGAVRLHGRTITYADPEVRAKIGVVQLMGGNAVFGPLSIDENLRMAAYLYAGEDAHRRVAAVLERFPMLRERSKSNAQDLSGGQQQVLAIAMALVHEPEVLIIDELSLGLAPVVVQQLLDIVRQLKDQGLTMIVVEQSLNVALSIADRAVFMEKGQVRFDGPAADLAQRDDLVRAVFLGADE